MATSLLTPGEGIFKTFVTWDDIEQKIQQALNTSATFGRNKTVKNIGDGSGFLSRICLIKPDWRNTTADEHLPSQFVAKIPTGITMHEAMERVAEKLNQQESGAFDSKVFDMMLIALESKIRSLHNAEITTYEVIKEYGNSVIPIIKIYHMEKYTEENQMKGLILMDYVEGLSHVHMDTNLQPSDLKPALQGLARLAAITTQLPDQTKASYRTDLLDSVFGELMEKEAWDSMMMSMREFFGPRMECLFDRFQASKDQFNLEEADKIPETLGMERVLCHGDMWATNCLWTKQNDKYQLAAMIDFQTANLGCPIHDLTRLMNCVLSGKVRREYWERILEEYYGYLLEELKGEKSPFTLEQLKESYTHFYHIGVFLVVTMMQAIIDNLTENHTEEKKQEIMEIITEKTECLLEDMLENLEKLKKIKEEKHEKFGF